MTQGFNLPSIAVFGAGLLAFLFPAILIPTFGLSLYVHPAVRKAFSFDLLDACWLLAALILGAPLLRYGYDPVTASLVLGWLLYKASSSPKHYNGPLIKAGLHGLTCGSLLLLVAAFSQVQFGALERAVGFEGHSVANLFGHSVLTLGLILCLTWHSHKTDGQAKQLMPLGLAAVFMTLLLSGSRAALLAFTLAFTLLALKFWRKPLFIAWLVATGIASILILSPQLRRLNALPYETDTGQVSNLLIASEDLRAEAWLKARVGISQSPDSEHSDIQQWDIQKRSEGSWPGVRQIVRILPGLAYTLSAEVKAEARSQPGFLALASPDESGDRVALAVFQKQSEWSSRTNAYTRIIRLDNIALKDGWQRLELSFVQEQDRPLSFYIGPVPDFQRADSDATMSVRRLQFEQGEHATPYQATYIPTAEERARSAARARPFYWRAAWSGFLERPLWGWSRASLSDYLIQHPEQIDFSFVLPSHAHNLWLHTAFKRGSTGLLGLMLWLVVIILPPLIARDGGTVILILTVLLANFFDYSLFYGGVLYPLCLYLGYRYGLVRSSRTSGAEARRGSA